MGSHHTSRSNSTRRQRHIPVTSVVVRNQFRAQKVVRSGPTVYRDVRVKLSSTPSSFAYRFSGMETNERENGSKETLRAHLYTHIYTHTHTHILMHTLMMHNTRNTKKHIPLELNAWGYVAVKLARSRGGWSASPRCVALRRAVSRWGFSHPARRSVARIHRPRRVELGIATTTTTTSVVRW